MSETVTMTLTEFLLARIAEDEAVALTAVGYESRAYWSDAVSTKALRGLSVLHYERHTPDRVLAECAAKRRIVDLVVDAEKHTRIDLPKNYMRATLRALASVHADHPDYRAEWSA